MIVKGKVRFVNEYADGSKSVEIHFSKANDFKYLPYTPNKRSDINLIVNDKEYLAGISHTDNNKYIWLNPSCFDDGAKVKLSNIILGAGFNNADDIYIKFIDRKAQVLTGDSLSQILFGEEECGDASTYKEGQVKIIQVNAYERNVNARVKCIKHYGDSCYICGFNFKNIYGDEADGFIHVHHIRPISEIGESYIVDPIRDLRPLCPNCHAFIHLDGNCKTIEEVKKIIKIS